MTIWASYTSTRKLAELRQSALSHTGRDRLNKAIVVMEAVFLELKKRDDKIADLEALLAKADKRHDERLYELQQLQKRYIPNWEQQVEARIEAGTRRLHGERTANNG